MSKKPVYVYVLHDDRKTKNIKFVWPILLLFWYLVISVNGEIHSAYITG